MLNKKQSRFRIIGATGLSIFSLFAAFFGTYAWFTSLRINQEQADTFEVTSTTDFLKQIDIFKQEGTPTEDDDNKVTYSFSSTATDTYIPGTGWKNSASLQIGQFDPLNISPTSLILITLKDNIPQENLSEFSLSLSTTTVFSNCLLSESNKFQESGNPFSSVLTFSAVPLTEAPTATDSKYSFTISSASPSSTNSFVKKLPTSSTEFPESDYQTRFSVLENTASSPVVTSSTKYIALFPQYSKDIMEFLFTLNLNNSVLTKETVMNSGISFTCDWNLII